MPKYIVGAALEEPNRNGIVYTRECMEKAIDNVRSLIKENRFLGEFQFGDRGTSVNLSNVSHIVTGLCIEENLLVADIKVLETPKGIQLKDLIDTGEVVFETRGLGKFGEDKTVTDFTLISIDAFYKYEHTNKETK